MKKTLRDRCAAFLATMTANQVIRKGSSVEDLQGFVIADIGRHAASDVLGQSLPLCVYFACETDREEFIAAIRGWRPNLEVRRLP